MQGSSTLQVVSLITTISLAFIGYVIAHLNAVRLEKKRARIKFISDQLQYLYGPLFSLSHTTQVAWRFFRQHWHPRETPYWNELSQEDKEQWCLWIREVFMPMNVAMEKVIIENAHLIRGGTMPPSLIDFLAHVEAYKVTLKEWEKNDYSNGKSYINYPDRLDQYIADEFEALKRRQVDLLGKAIQEST